MIDELSQIGDEEFAPGWRPQEGDKIVGKVLNVARAWSKETNSYYIVITVQDESTNEPIAIHCFHYSLEKKMHELKPKKGERIAVYRGKQVPIEGTSRTVVNYNVKVEGRDAPDIWDTTGPQKKDSNVEEKEILTKDLPEDDGEAPW